MSVSVNIQKNFGEFSLDLAFNADNETVALLGASGCGKSMTLRCIAGIEKPDKGKIVVDGITLFDSEQKINLSPQERGVGLLFQNYALFPNMTVYQNVYTGAKREKDKSLRRESIDQMLKLFDLDKLRDRYPSQLSGGQQQRAALARILVSRPKILMLDEPFSALDSHLRFRLEKKLLDITKSFDGTVILVTHSRDEVFRLSDKVAVINNGHIDAFDTKAGIFRAPQTVYAARLTGCKNVSHVVLNSNGTLFASRWGVTLKCNCPENTKFIGVRMHSIRHGAGENTLRCRVVQIIENPFSYTVMLAPDGADSYEPIGWELDKDAWHNVENEFVTISIPECEILPLYQ